MVCKCSESRFANVFPCRFAFHLGIVDVMHVLQCSAMMMSCQSFTHPPFPLVYLLSTFESWCSFFLVAGWLTNDVLTVSSFSVWMITNGTNRLLCHSTLDNRLSIHLFPMQIPSFLLSRTLTISVDSRPRQILSSSFVMQKIICRRSSSMSMINSLNCFLSDSLSRSLRESWMLV